MIQSHVGALGPMCCLEAGPLPSRVRSSRGHPLGKGRGTATGLQHRQERLTGPGHPGPPAGWGKGAGPGCSRHRGDPEASGGGREVVQGHIGTPARPQQGVSGGNQGPSQGQAPVMGEGTHLRGLVSATNPAPAHSTQQGARTAPPRGLRLHTHELETKHSGRRPCRPRLRAAPLNPQSDHATRLPRRLHQRRAPFTSLAPASPSSAERWQRPLPLLPQPEPAYHHPPRATSPAGSPHPPPRAEHSVCGADAEISTSTRTPSRKPLLG